jgi:hypothetical protein
MFATAPMHRARMPGPSQSHQPNQKRAPPIADVFRALVDRFEQRQEHSISAMAIAAEYHLSHRRVYEFFSLLSSLGVCSYIDRSQLTWNGLAQVPAAIEAAYTELEVAFRDAPIDAAFKLDESPNLGTIALRIVSVYLYVGAESLSMRRIALLLHDGLANLKSLQRRMYLVLNFMEVIGIVHRTKTVGEYRLFLNRTAIVATAMKKRQEACDGSGPLILETLLSRHGPEFLEPLHAKRFAAFTEATRDANKPSAFPIYLYFSPQNPASV